VLVAGFIKHILKISGALNASVRNRIIAWLLSVLMISGAFIPTASSVYAMKQISQPPNTSNSHIPAKNPDLTTKEHTFGTPGAAPTTTSKVGAIDAKPVGLSAILGNSTTSGTQSTIQTVQPKPKVTTHEVTNLRTATRSVTEKADGTFVQTNYVTPHFYKKSGSWTPINNTLSEDTNAADSGNIFGKALGKVESLVSSPNDYIVNNNSWHARFSPSGSERGMVRLQQGSDQIGFTPLNANKVDPVITTNNGIQTVHYYNLWSGVDVEYTVQNSAIKENVILKNKQSTNSVSFHLTGATLKKVVGADGTKSYTIEGAFDDAFGIQAADLVLNNFGPVTDASAVSQDYKDGNVTLAVGRDYLKSLPASAFPAVIDPGVSQVTPFGTRAYGNYVEFKTDGYICPYNVCNVYAGSLYDSNYNLQYWRGAINAPYDEFRNSSNVLSNATLHLSQFVNVGYWTGTYATHTVQVGHANCLNSFYCLNGGVFSDAASVSTSGDIDVTNIYQQAISGGDYGAWLMIGSEDGTTSSFKDYNPDQSYVTFSYNGVPSAPSITTPSTNQVFTDTQPSFNVNYQQNPNSSTTPLQYEYLVSTSPGGTGTLIDSGDINSTQWTVPDNVLQDGTTYYVQARTYDPTSYLASDWGSSVAFRIDLRTGQDKSQSYDTAGPASVDLATGNLTTANGTHASTALGGSLGVKLDYNSPLKSRNGLVGRYWNVSSGYSAGTPTTAPDLTRVDQNVDFDWSSGSPDAAINSSWFFTAWDGYFVAPQTGTYYFGTNVDDTANVSVNNQVVSSGGCYTGICYGSSITLQAGQVVPFKANYEQATGPNYVHIHVKTPDNIDQVIPSTWLQTGVRDATPHYGLTGRYYTDDGSHSFTDTSNVMFMQRNDTLTSFNWGSGSPVAGGPSDNFLVKWTGYITVPKTGSYEFDTDADDGTRVIVSPGGTASTVLSNWQDNSAPYSGSSITLSANTPTPIEVDYYDHTGNAKMALKVQSSSLGLAQQVVPSDWLSPEAQVLPNGWNLDLDADGNIQYDRLTATSAGATLSNTAGDSYEYTYSNGGYTPPADDDGNLVRNADGTFTLQASNGMTYVFGVDGNLMSATTATSATHPTALKYVYQSENGGPAHLYQILDGVDTSRNATLYYSGDSGCGTSLTGFDSAPPAGMLCALGTNDGQMTHFYYTNGQLALVVKPGWDMTRYGYEQVQDASSNVIGYRVNDIRTSLAMDAVDASIRADDGTEDTTLVYDSIGRVSSVTEPAATAGATRIVHSYEYLPGAKSTQDSLGNATLSYAGATEVHVSGMTEPNGYSKRIEFDNLFRTIQDTSNLGLTTTTQWNPSLDLVYSTTNPQGLMTTTVYDDEDRPVSSYGPAPSTWFNTTDPSSQTPLTTYASQIPRIDVSYDQSIVGPAVAWYDYSKQSGSTSGTLFGAPKLEKTGINTSTGVMSNDFTSPPVTAGSGMQGIGFSATGKLRLAAGTYTVSATAPDGIRLWVDNKIVTDQWTDSSTSRTTTNSFTVTGTAPHVFMLDAYRNTGTTGTFSVTLQQGGGFAATTDWSSYLSPDYSLATSAKVYDSTLGNSTVTSNYGSSPELGQVQSNSADPTGLNLTTSNTYETEGATGSLLRQTSASLPGNTTSDPTYTYAYYGATETRQDPCNTSLTFKQAGMLKSVTTASPDGGTTPGSTTETVYDDAGRIVATDVNSGGWSCTTYDSRGRIDTVSVPAFNGEAARTTSYDYAVSGNPLVSAVWDSAGAVTTTIDLLGRTVGYEDIIGDSSTYVYNTENELASITSAAGEEEYEYDEYGRLTNTKFGGTTYSTVYYDQYSNVDHVAYNQAGSMKLTPERDTLDRTNGVAYVLGDGSTAISDTASLTQSGKVSSDTVQSGSTTLASTYSYDGAGRLTGANIGTNTYAYGYGTQNSSCGTGSNMNANAGKNGNRTSQTINGVTTTYCYNYADQLVSSSDPTASGVQYDAHGNITQIGSGSDPLVLNYDSSDRNYGLAQYNSSGDGTAMYYNHDALGRVTYREQDAISNWSWNMASQNWYGYTGSGTQFTRNASWAIDEADIQLPGGVLLTVKPQQTGNAQKEYSLPNALGHTFLTTNAAGTNNSNGSGPLSSFVYDPFGNMVAGGNSAQNTLTGGSFGFGGANKKLTEASIPMTPILMGARIYLPTIGRFTSMDPVPGGNANAYTYSLDPINFSDYSGRCSTGAVACFSASQVAGMQSSSTAAQYLQTTVSAARIIYSSAATSHITYSTAARTAAKPAIVYNNSGALPVATVVSIADSSMGQSVLHHAVGIGVSAFAATGAAACVASVACGATTMVVGFVGLVAAGAGADYGVSDAQNRQRGIAYWVGQSFVSVSGGAICGTLFEMSCGGAGRSVLETAWKYFNY
jgi:RHS repeat-associated protein